MVASVASDHTPILHEPEATAPGLLGTYRRLGGARATAVELALTRSVAARALVDGQLTGGPVAVASIAMAPSRVGTA